MVPLMEEVCDGMFLEVEARLACMMSAHDKSYDALVGVDGECSAVRQ